MALFHLLIMSLTVFGTLNMCEKSPIFFPGPLLIIVIINCNGNYCCFPLLVLFISVMLFGTFQSQIILSKQLEGKDLKRGFK